MLTPVSNQPNPNVHIQHNRCGGTSTASTVNGLSTCMTLAGLASTTLIAASIIGVMSPLAAIVGTITLLSIAALCCGTGPRRVSYVGVRPAPVFTSPFFFGAPRGAGAYRAGAGFARPGGGHGGMRARYR